MPCAFHHVHPCRTQLLCLAERAIQSMTAACDPKLCKSSVPIFNTIPKERPYRARASYILPYRIRASGHRNLGLDHYQHFQHFSALVHSSGRQRLSEIQSVWPSGFKCQLLLFPVKSQTCDLVSGDNLGSGATASPSWNEL